MTEPFWNFVCGGYGHCWTFQVGGSSSRRKFKKKKSKRKQMFGIQCSLLCYITPWYIFLFSVDGLKIASFCSFEFIVFVRLLILSLPRCTSLIRSLKTQIDDEKIKLFNSTWTTIAVRNYWNNCEKRIVPVSTSNVKLFLETIWSGWR